MANALKRALALVAGLALTLVPWTAAPARAGTEEFSTFHVDTQEEDDESVIDHVLARLPLAWRDEWERSPQAMRTAQGCLTSGQWFMDTDLKLESPLGRTARFGLDFNQVAGDISTYDFLDFWFRFRTRAGRIGTMFRPMHDKSRQDFALAWERGADSTAFQARAIWGFEDLFNNLWAFRQTRVGERSEAYRRHPWEPALELAFRHERWRAALSGKFLTPSEKRVPGLAPTDPEHRTTLWGTLARASVEARALGLEWSAASANQQARSSDRPLDGFSGDDSDLRRNWSAEAAVGRALRPHLTAEARWIYSDRAESYGAPTGPGTFRSVDRVLQLECVGRLAPTLDLRLGGLYDEITVSRVGRTPRWSYGTRHESRGYFGLNARFGRVRVAGVEGIELDPEPYAVWLVHDKAFLSLQTTF